MMKKRRVRSSMLFSAAAVACVSRYALATPPNSSYRLVFADEFNGTSLDTSKWVAASPGWTMPNSASTASANQVSEANGVLTLSATRTTAAGAFTSGSISSYNKYTFTGGYTEARIYLPSTPGSWPAFWGLYNGWPPEADIMEYPLTTNGTLGLSSSQYNTNYHYLNSSGNAAAGAGAVSTGSALNAGWHTFGMDWISSTSMAFYLDGTQVTSYTGASVSQMQYMYMILDYAVGGWPGTPSTTQWPVGFTDQMKVDWVRVWQTNPNADANTNWTVNGGGAFATAGNWSLGVPKYGNETAYFGRVGSAAAATISLSSWQVLGGITFDGTTGGSTPGTTAYTLGTSANQIQLATTGTNTTVQATVNSTVSQTINAGIELWSNSTFRNDMTSGQLLNINGNLTGNGGLDVEGVGAVVLSGTGSYAGTTTINGSSTQGPGVLRANADSAMSTGTVTIGSNGNSTTARLELIGGHTQPNNIDFRGRTNNSVGIENVSGNNTLSGTIAANVGGGTFQIQSDSGTLTLSGAGSLASVPGVALQSTTGSRTFTLQGVGNGVVSGNIQDGGGTISISKAGTGQWTLAGSNPYSGATTISAGTLLLNGVGIAKSSSVTVASGGTLSITGTSGSSIATGGTLTSSGGINMADGAIETLNVGSGLALSSATLNVDIGTSSADRISAAGASGSGANNTINISPVLGQSMTPGSSYTIVSASGGLSAANFKVGTKPASLGFYNFTPLTPTSTALLLNVTGNSTPGTAYWTGRGSSLSGDSSDNWGAGAAIGTSNWSTDSAGTVDAQQLPGSTTNVVFTGGSASGTTGVLNTQLDSTYAVKGLTFDVPSAPAINSVVFGNNGYALTVGSGGVTVASTSNASASIGGSAAMMVDGAQAWANNSNTRSLTVNSPVAALAPGATTLSFNGAGTGGINLNGVISDGSGTLSTVFNQAGTTILSASNTYSGATTLSSGTVQISGTGQIVSDSTVASGATLMINGGSDGIGDANAVTVLSGGIFDVRGSTGSVAKTETIGTLNGAGLVTRGNSGLSTLSISGGSFAGTIQDGAGQFALVKIGSGTATLSGSSTFTGGVTINDGGGVLAISNAAALGTGSVTVGNGGSNQSGELQLSGNMTLTSVGTINFGSRNVSNAGGTADLENLYGNNSVSANLNISNTGGNSVNILSTAGLLTLSGNLSSIGLSGAHGFDFYGAGNGQVSGIISNGTAQPTFVQMDGPGTWTLTNNNTFTGGITVNGGTLALTGNNNFGAGSLMVTDGVAFLSASNTYTGGTTMDSGTVIVGSLSALGSGSITAINGGPSSRGAVVIQTDGNDTPYALNVASGFEMAVISDVKTGSIGLNHTLGNLAIGRGSTLDALAGGNVQSGTASITLGTVTLSSGVGAGSSSFNPTTANLILGAVSTSTNTAKILNLAGTSAGNSITGAITDGANTMAIEKSNSSTWTLTHSNAYSGGTVIDDNGGILAITNAAALGTGSVTIGQGNTNTSGELQLSGNIAVTGVPTINFESRLASNAGGTADIENLSGNNSLSASLVVNNAGGNTVNVLSTAGKLTLSGKLSSSGLSSARGFDFYGAGNGQVDGVISDGTAVPTTVQKDGTGTWTLTQNNTYSGTTTINAGTLVVSGTHSGGGSYMIGAGAVLAGTGTLNLASAATATVSGTLVPGPGLAVMTIGSSSTKSSVKFASGGALSIELGSGNLSDELAVNGSIDLSSSTDSLQLISLPGAFNGSTYTIATFTPGTLNNQKFDQVFLNGLATPAGTDSAGSLGNGYGVVYDNFYGLVEVMPVPEPAIAVTVVSLALTLRRRPRRPALGQ